MVSQDMASALVEAIKVAGLVLVADTSGSPQTQESSSPVLGPSHNNAAEGVNGVLYGNGVLRFYDTIAV